MKKSARVMARVGLLAVTLAGAVLTQAAAGVWKGRTEHSLDAFLGAVGDVDVSSISVGFGRFVSDTTEVNVMFGSDHVEGEPTITTWGLGLTQHFVSSPEEKTVPYVSGRLVRASGGGESASGTVLSVGVLTFVTPDWGYFIGFKKGSVEGFDISGLGVGISVFR